MSWKKPTPKAPFGSSLQNQFGNASLLLCKPQNHFWLCLCGGFKRFYFHLLFGEMIQFDDNIFQRGLTHYIVIYIYIYIYIWEGLKNGPSKNCGYLLRRHPFRDFETLLRCNNKNRFRPCRWHWDIGTIYVYIGTLGTNDTKKPPKSRRLSKNYQTIFFLSGYVFPSRLSKPFFLSTIFAHVFFFPPPTPAEISSKCWFQTFLIVTLTWANAPMWQAYFSNEWLNHQLENNDLERVEQKLNTRIRLGRSLSSWLQRRCNIKIPKVKELHSKIGKVLEVLRFFHNGWRGKWVWGFLLLLLLLLFLKVGSDGILHYLESVHVYK